jgi:hypothetical protein
MKSLDLTGKIYGDWTVLKEGTYISTHKRWWCKCHCGKKRQVLQTSLIRGASHSCGCRKTRIGKANLNWNGCGNITGSHWASIKNGAKSRNIEFNLDMESAWKLFIKQNEKCAISGIKLVFSESYNRELAKEAKQETTASLDRIDSSKGYVKGNVQWVHKIVNMMKRKLSDTEFITWCKLIANNND